MSKPFAILFGAALASTLDRSARPRRKRSRRRLRPMRHQAQFPGDVGGATFDGLFNYAAPPANSPELGTSYFYSTPKKMVITVQVFGRWRRVRQAATIQR